MRGTAVEPGAAVLARNAFDEWIEAIAVTGIEGTHRDGVKIHDFPVVWIKAGGVGEPIPWPAEDVIIRESAMTHDQGKGMFVAERATPNG